MPSFLFILLVVASGFWFPDQAQQLNLDTASTPGRPVYRVVQEQPQYPGGMRPLINYLQKNQRYPENARKAGLEGRVFVTFIVSEQGAIQNVQVLRSVNIEFDAEAVRLIKSMPNWIPAKQGGQAVACRYNLPVDFSLKGNS